MSAHRGLPPMALERESAETICEDLLPTRGRIALSVYDHTPADPRQRQYRALPGHTLKTAIYSEKELHALWAAIDALLRSDSWHDTPTRDRYAAMAADAGE